MTGDHVQYVSQFDSHWWTEICKRVRRAVVFIDGNAAECLHWNGGLARLYESGVEAVKELNSFESGDEKQKKAVFIVDGPAAHLKVLFDLRNLWPSVQRVHFF